MNGALSIKRKSSDVMEWLPCVAVVMAAAIFICAMASGTVYANADNFTDLFRTNSFRGAFEWIKHLDWVGTIVQIVISTFCLFGVALLVIRIMTSMLYLSAKGMWEEVAEYKSGNSGGEKDFLGMFGMAKSWASGKSGTGLDAIIGAVLMLLPDVKRYSDFGPKAKNDKLKEDMTISQYILAIALPTVLTVFFFAMGFNGTLWQAIATTVDMMGSFADKVISVNYSGFVNDIINSATGYKFYLDDGTNYGKLQQTAAKEAYAKAVSNMVNPNEGQLTTVGEAIENEIRRIFTDDGSKTPADLLPNWPIKGLDPKIKAGLSDEVYCDYYVDYIGVTTIMTGSATQSGSIGCFSLSDIMTQAGLGTNDRDIYIHFCLQQEGSYSGGWDVLDTPALNDETLS